MKTARIKKHRMFVILIGITAVLLLWNLRLFWIQAGAVHHFGGRDIDLAVNSVIQRAEGIVLDSGRGDFLDRRLQPLTGRELRVLVLFPVSRQELEEEGPAKEAYAEAAQILKVPAGEWLSYVAGLRSPELWRKAGVPAALSDNQVRLLETLGLPGVRILPYKQRYTENQTAGQLIGFIGQNPERITKEFTDQFHKGELQLTSKIGNAGLEKTFEPWLQGLGTTSVSLFTDGTKRPLPGLDVRKIAPDNPYYPLQVVTTLDGEIQQQIEKRMEALHIREGAVVVLDAQTGDTVAAASRPAFHPDHVDLSGGGWSNRTVKAATPGSIFKTVTAAAALESHAVRPGETFECKGELGRFGLSCWKEGGHGRLTLEEAYAQSCNVVFAKVAERLGGEALERYAGKLGLTMPVGWSGEVPGYGLLHQWDGEESGLVYRNPASAKDAGAVAQTSIGQRDVQVTPLAAANLVVTLLRQGEVGSPRIASEIRFRGGRLYEGFAPRPLDSRTAEGIRPAIAKKLLAWMQEVVAEGTGQPLQRAKWKLAGKSGTAQITMKNGRPGENHWFVGYGPAEHPRYTAAVLIGQVPEGQKNTSLTLFREVMDVLAEVEAKAKAAKTKEVPTPS
ncbi:MULTISPECIES: peptidoglycan D,D-transpeptidase FtsI family protein [Paenibacillus]|uniref:peptidoglycan D,D-transpeptidase FtsI family protein n=1 Tax=Paenibacillus TaxID=44249 RepID=UPI0022B9159D|nr:penicillin-binding transpeptidase domain-containing protein [Paenibacillus caseinilyticus]MCZ8519015.1 penicillin-binding transpeptidase domain-containing protein [Paenibacillus caseinilyticus]